MKIKNFLFAVTAFCGLFTAVNPAFAQTWTLTSAPTNDYLYTLACSADGSKMAAAMYADAGVNYPGAIYTSTNAGVTWAVSGAPSNYWSSIASSTNGNKLVAVVQGGGIYLSTNAGATWTNTSAPNAYWYAVAAAGGGGKFVAVAGGSDRFIYISTNSGDTWTNAGAPNSEYWYAVASSVDGKKLVAVSNSNTNGGPGAIYTSTNSGGMWASNNVARNYWNSVASSADGTKLVAVTGNAIFISKNSGGTWTSTNNPSGYWNSVASSADGSKLAIAKNQAVYISSDSGATWTNNAPALNWTGVAVSFDGNKLAASAYSAGIYTLQSAPSLNLAFSTNLTFAWPWPSTGYGLQQNTNLLTTNWVTVTNIPVFTNWQNQVTLSRSNGNHFFRLKSP